MSIFVDYRDLFHRVNTKSNIFTSDEVTSENIYFWCSRGEIKPIIHKKRQFFFLFNAKNAVLTLKIRRATKNGAKNETTFGLKERRHALLVPVTFTLGSNNNVRTGYHIW